MSPKPTRALHPTIFAGVELGGAKTIAAIGRGRDILDRISVPTTTPVQTLSAIGAQLRAWGQRQALSGLGVASFGPVCIRAGDLDYGRMLATPKPGWAGADIVGWLSAAVPGPCGLHTDVTAAALAEGAHGAARGHGDFVYVTVGTGVGVGLIANGQAVSGMMHPEGGHLRVRRTRGDPFPGTCSFHGDCLEGLASGPAIAARAGRAPFELSPDDPAWVFVADALAEGFASLFLTLAPSLIVAGGGVILGRPWLLPQVQRLVVDKLGGYLPFIDRTRIATMIVPAGLGGDAGLIGALALAEGATREVSGATPGRPAPP